MTKLDGRDAKSATMQLDESLKRLQVDHVDLIQFHDVARMDDPEKIFAPGGALEGMSKARKEGKVRYIGFTGHKSPQIHLHMLDVAFKHNFIFDTARVVLCWRRRDQCFGNLACFRLRMMSSNSSGVEHHRRFCGAD